MKALNIGCGSTAHPDWINIDLVPFSDQVKFCDFRQGLPYPESYFGVCYTSHVLEHLEQREAQHLLIECFRVLNAQGVMRVVVPDLEGIVRNYLQTLEQTESGNLAATFNYDWMILELYDQVVRSSMGGEMGQYLARSDLKNKDFILSRIGLEAESFWEKEAIFKPRSLWEKVKSKNIVWFLQTFRTELAKLLVKLIAGKQAEQAFSEGLFRSSGEIHRWMYDRFSLRRLLETAGFIDIKVCQANESRILDFDRYELDVVGGRVRKPDSLFMEGIKP